MDEILIALLITVPGNIKERLINPFDKADQVIHDAIYTFWDIPGGAEEVAAFLEIHLPYFAKMENKEALERIRLSAEKIRKSIQMFR